MLNDFESEQALLSNIIKYGLDGYHDISTTGVSAETFSDENHKIIYHAIEHLFEEENLQKLDVPLIMGASRSLGYGEWCSELNIDEYIKTEIQSVHTEQHSGANYAKRLRKLQVANNILEAVEEIQNEVQDITGQEKLSDIFGIVEGKLSDLAGFLTDTSDDPVDVGSTIFDHVEYLKDNQIDQLGLPTGFPIYDKHIGGGLRKHAIHVVAARPKVGKSTFCKNVALNVAKTGIPVLYLDTEMESEDQLNRLIASEARVSLSDIETGKFNDNSISRQNVDKATQTLIDCKLHHKNIAGMNLDSQLAVARKWILRDVGLDKDGLANDCLLVYDYIKIMDSQELSKYQEYQALGFLMTALQNFAVKYDIPILTAAQLNRDGIERADTSAISASDRIAMYCSSISILKDKSEEEQSAQNHAWGNQKLYPVIARYGEPMGSDDYINILFEKSFNKMGEKGIRSEVPSGEDDVTE